MLTKPEVEALLSEAQAAIDIAKPYIDGEHRAYARNFAWPGLFRANADLAAALREQAGEVEKLNGQIDAQQDLLSKYSDDLNAQAALLAECREVIEPFAKVQQEATKPYPGEDDSRTPRPDENPAWGFNRATLLWGHFRKAAALHAKLGAHNV